MAKKATSSKSSKKKLTETNHTVDKTIESKNKASINSHPKVSSSSSPTNHWLNFLNYVKRSTAAKSAFAVLALLLVIFGATFTINQINNNQDDASAGLNCPNGGTPGGPGGPGYDPNTCYVQTSTNSFTQTTVSNVQIQDYQFSNCKDYSVTRTWTGRNYSTSAVCNEFHDENAPYIQAGRTLEGYVDRITVGESCFGLCGTANFGASPLRDAGDGRMVYFRAVLGSPSFNYFEDLCANRLGHFSLTTSDYNNGQNYYGPPDFTQPVPAGAQVGCVAVGGPEPYSGPAFYNTSTTQWTPTGGVTFTPSSPADISSTVCTPENLDRTTGTTTCTVTFNNPSNAPLNLGQGTGNPFTIALTNLARTNTAGQSDGPEIVNNSTARFSNVPTTGTSNGSPLQPADTQVEAQLFQPGVVGLYTGEIITLTSTPTTPATTLTPGTGNVTGTIGQPLTPITGLGGNYTGPATVTLPGGQVITGNVGTGGTFTPNPNQPINTNTPIGTGNSTLTPTGPNAPAPITVPTTITAPTLGNPTATTASPITGTVGQPLPTIPLTGGNLPDGTPATFTPGGSTTPIPGTIQNGNFVPTTGSIIPLDSTTGPTTGTLTSPGTTPVTVPTNFTPATTLTPGTGNVTGTIGQPLTPITGLGGNYTGPATVTLPGGQVITGNVGTGGTFTPNPNQPINTNTPIGTGNSTLTPTGPNAPGPITVPTTITAPTLGNPTATTASPITGTVGQPLPTIPLTGGNLPDGTPATFTPGGSTTPIPGTIQNGNFVPTTGSIIPLDSTTGPTTGTLTSPGTTPVTVPTNFTPATTPATAQQLIDAIDCTPQTVTVGGTIVCDGQLPANTTADNLQVQLQNNGNPVNCTVTTTGAITCPPITTTTPGTNLPITATTTTVTTPATVDTATVSSTPTTIGADNTGNGTCTPATVTIGGVTTCTFPLTGNLDNNYVLPTNGITSNITTATGNSSPCMIIGNGTTTATLSCPNVPTTNGTPGNQTATTNLPNENSTAPVTLTTPITTSTLTPGTGNVTGTIGQPLTPITGLGGNYTGPATVTLPGGQPITGIVDNGTFTPNPNQPINTNTTPGPNQISTLTPTGPNAPTAVFLPTTITAPTTPTNNPTLGNPTATTASPITGTVGQPLPTIPLTGGNLPDGTPATFTPGGSTTPIPGTIQNGNFVPTTGSIIPLDSTTGPTTGTLTSPGTTPVTVPTNFTPATTPATAQQLIDAIDCTPQTVTVGGTIVCDGQLPANTTADNLQVQLQNNGNPVNCTVTTTGAITCPPITTTTPGTNLPITATTTTVTTPATVDTATVSSTPTTAPTIITPTNIGNSTDCTSSKTVTIPNTYTCDFPLTGSATNNYQQPEDGIRATTETANGISSLCTIENNNTPQALLRCTQIPTEQGESGIRDVNLAVSCSVSQVSTNNNQNSNTLQKALYAIVTGIPTYAGGDCTTVPRGEVTLQTSFLPPITVRSGGAALAALLAAGGAVGGVLAYRKSQKRKLKVG